MCYLRSFDFLLSLGAKQKQAPGASLRICEPSTGSPRHWNRVRERDSVRPLGLWADELERLTTLRPGIVEEDQGTLFGRLFGAPLRYFEDHPRIRLSCVIICQIVGRHSYSFWATFISLQLRPASLELIGIAGPLPVELGKNTEL